MTDWSKREARLRPEFAHLYPALLADQWESAAILTDRMVAWYLHQASPRFIATDRILPVEHFEFRGASPRPGDPPTDRSRRTDTPPEGQP